MMYVSPRPRPPARRISSYSRYKVTPYPSPLDSRHNSDTSARFLPYFSSPSSPRRSLIRRVYRKLAKMRFGKSRKLTSPKRGRRKLRKSQSQAPLSIGGPTGLKVNPEPNLGWKTSRISFRLPIRTSVHEPQFSKMCLELPELEEEPTLAPSATLHEFKPTKLSVHDSPPLPKLQISESSVSSHREGGLSSHPPGGEAFQPLLSSVAEQGSQRPSSLEIRKTIQIDVHRSDSVVRQDLNTHSPGRRSK